MEKLWFLSKIQLQKSFTHDDHLVLHEMIKTRQYSKGEMIQKPGTHYNGTSVIAQGRVRIFGVDGQGKTVTHCILSKDSYFGNSKYFTMGTEDIGIQALENAVIILYNEEAFDSFLSTNAQCVNSVVASIAEGKRLQAIMYAEMNALEVKERLMIWLNQLAASHGSLIGKYVTIQLNLTSEDLAFMIDAQPLEITKALAELAKEGTIVSNFQKISILQ